MVKQVKLRSLLENITCNWAITKEQIIKTNSTRSTFTITSFIQYNIQTKDHTKFQKRKTLIWKVYVRKKMI